MSRGPHPVAEFLSPRGADSASVASQDTIDELMKNFRIGLSPELRFKFPKEVGNVKMSASLTVQPFARGEQRPGPSAKFVIKPVGDKTTSWKTIRKFEIDTQEKAIKLYSTKFKLGPLTIQFKAGHNWATGRQGLAYNVKVMGPLGVASDGSRKYRRDINEHVSANAKVFYDYNLPGLEGRISNAEEERYNSVNTGYVECDLRRLELVVKLDKPKKIEIVEPEICSTCGGAGVLPPLATAI